MNGREDGEDFYQFVTWDGKDKFVGNKRTT